jgi:hypothetical protein
MDASRARSDPERRTHTHTHTHTHAPAVSVTGAALVTVQRPSRTMSSLPHTPPLGSAVCPAPSTSDRSVFTSWLSSATGKPRSAGRPCGERAPFQPASRRRFIQLQLPRNWPHAYKPIAELIDPRSLNA